MKDHIVSFSFGQTSGYMLRRLMDANPKDFDKKFLVVFENTGKEHPATLDFGHEVETRWGVPIVWLEYCRVNNQHAFKVVDYASASRNGEPFGAMLAWASTLPNVQGRGCSGQLKVRTQKRYLKSIGLTEWTAYVGIRADEAHRKLEILAANPKYIDAHFPLIDYGITKPDVDAWWDAQPFKLNIPNYKGNCDLCFLKAKWKRLAIVREDPTVADWWIAAEKAMKAKGVTGDGARWIAGHSYEGLLADATHPEFNFTTDEPDIPCSCAVGGYRSDDESEE